jgi:hypothetical protein
LRIENGGALVSAECANFGPLTPLNSQFSILNSQFSILNSQFFSILN